jgi:amino acid transporter
VAVLGKSDVDPLTAFLGYTEAILGSEGWVKWIIGIPLVVALLLSALNAIMGCGRSLYQVAQDGVIPKFFQHTNRHGVPDRAMIFNLVASIIVVFLGSPLEIYIFSNMGYLLALALALIGYFLYRHQFPDLNRPIRLPSYMRYVALVIGVSFLFVWGYGGYYASDIAVAPGKRWLFFLGLGTCMLYLPMHAYRRWIEDRGDSGDSLDDTVRLNPLPNDAE